jgi:tetratricopeptide (TPR) repeat protein
MLEGVLTIEESPGNESIHVCEAFRTLSELHHHRGKYDDALRLCDRILALKQKGFPAGNMDTAQAILEIGHLYDHQGKFELALAKKKEALKIEENSHDYDPVISTRTIQRLGRPYQQMGKYQDALRKFQEALDVRERAFGVNHMGVAQNSWIHCGHSCRSNAIRARNGRISTDFGNQHKLFGRR